MKKTLLLFSFLFIINTLKAQHIIDGFPQDSTTFTFEANDSLVHTFGSPTPITVSIDTTNTHLWMIGKTHKVFFTTGGEDTTVAIMTDTSLPYYKGANDWFTMKFSSIPLNCIIDFHHKYQTLPGHHGGIVEFSLDHGTTWQNVTGDCDIDSFMGLAPGIFTTNFYSGSDTVNDTVYTGEHAFGGTISTWQYSRLQFFTAVPVRTTKGGPACDWNGKSLYLRFRFVSDSFPTPFDGWLIDDIKVEIDHYAGFVPGVGSYHTLNVYPNPAKDGIFVFPALNDEQKTTIEITDVLGQTLFKTPYTHKIDLSKYSAGLYLYKVVNSDEYYSGRLLTQ